MKTADNAELCQVIEAIGLPCWSNAPRSWPS